ncbi:nuclear transport factor 2 family protein [Segetibacter sp. 3557_3]|uniref:nuclear transport factor 2 family protein n=1 Tax=Segetibacter sp. 3557_3 TaxID=2547429 RepID=UPI0010590AEF|nr:nuclear transport factor 2 family protein [Segetibacter sp. 3557_3]TDH28918.1 nuclear transport factor 2 family protein [Segetibacter sp. 3557_3]
MYRVFVLFVMLIAAQKTGAQSAADSVKAAVTSLFTAMKTSDGQRLRACFTDSGMLQTIGANKLTGEPEVKSVAISRFAEQIGKLPKDSADERITFSSVQVDGDLASVWTPYEFYYAGKFSHCGVNSFQLVRTQGGWKIHYLIDTRRKTGCK